MRITSTMAGLSLLLIAAVSAEGAAPKIQFRKNENGRIQPFKLKQAPLLDFVQAYAEVAGVTILYAGMKKEIIGDVTIFSPKPMTLDALTERFYEALDQNGLTVIDAPKKMGWIIQRERDARDAPLPVYNLADAPPTHRLITVFVELKHEDAESAARAMRSFMPAYSRIIPTLDSRLMMTDTGANIRKAAQMLDLLDIPREVHSLPKDYRMSGKCPGDERTVEHLVIENVELGENAARQLGLPMPGPSSRPPGSYYTHTVTNGGAR